jgi:hypothetical protein
MIRFWSLLIFCVLVGQASAQRRRAIVEANPAPRQNKKEIAIAITPLDKSELSDTFWGYNVFRITITNKTDSAILIPVPAMFHHQNGNKTFYLEPAINHQNDSATHYSLENCETCSEALFQTRPILINPETSYIADFATFRFKGLKNLPFHLHYATTTYSHQELLVLYRNEGNKWKDKIPLQCQVSHNIVIQ